MMDELLAQFMIEARDLVPQAIAALDRLRADPADRAAIDAAFRAVHTLKGSVALFDMAPAGQMLHAAEDRLDAARAGRMRLDGGAVLALIACLDRTDAWVDAMEANGRLPPEAIADAARLVRRLGGPDEPADGGAPTPDAVPRAPEWVAAILARAPVSVLDGAGDLVAFRYDPDDACFFRGDDPLAIVAAIPELIALDIRPRTPWPDPDAFDPFACQLRIDGLSAAPLAAVQGALRTAGEQAAIVAVPRRQDEAATATDAVRTLRIDERRVDLLVDQIGELVVAANALAPIVADAGRIDAALAQRLRGFQAGLDRTTAAMQRAVASVRLVPVGSAVRRLPRLVREIADALGRTVDFGIEGAALEVDKAIADTLFEPLLHLVRNALDHGIETPETRRALGKPAGGTLRLRFERAGGQLHATLADDGAGIDPARVRALAIERGIVTAEAAALLDDRALTAMIFAPGFSTAAAVTNVSGRGVGMDAVRRAVEASGGRIEIDSAPGRGTTMRIVLPLSAITTRLLIVRAGGEEYAIAFDRIVESATIAADRVVAIGGGEALVLRGATVPLLHLAELVGGSRRTADDLRLVVVETGAERVALAIDGLGGRLDALVRPAAGLLATLPAIAGTTLLGDGAVLVVLDPERLIG